MSSDIVWHRGIRFSAGTPSSLAAVLGNLALANVQPRIKITYDNQDEALWGFVVCEGEGLCLEQHNAGKTELVTVGIAKVEAPGFYDEPLYTR